MGTSTADPGYLPPRSELSVESFPEVVDALYEALYSADTDRHALERTLRDLERQHGNSVHAELIHLLCHLRFAPAEAREHWTRIVAHREWMGSRLGSPVDLRLALVSYFLEVDRRFQVPKIIEMRLYEQTRASAYVDELTGLRNYRLFREYLEREAERSLRYGAPLSLVMIDVDSFKHYNDRNGHEAGNEVLVAIAALLAQSLRKVDLPARYGGEEFGLILPSTSKKDAALVAERTRSRIESHAFPLGQHQPEGRLTVSLGVATLPADARGAADLVRCADRALYGAKEKGKNRVQLYGECRRSYRRIEASLNGSCGFVAVEDHPLTTRNISEGGLLCLTDRELPLGSLIDVRLNLDGNEVAASGRVVRVEQAESGRFEAAIRILSADRNDRERLAAYISAHAAEDQAADES
jgi:diguanylate cyclase (GGDEF)-like protein